MSDEEQPLGIDLYWSILITFSAGALGYLLSYFREKSQYKARLKKQKVTNLLETRLREFYWPLYLRLEELYQVGKTFSRSEMIKWNESIFEIIYSKIYLGAEQKLVQSAIAYMRIFSEWERSKEGVEYFPFDELAKFLSEIQEKTSIEQERYNMMIGESTNNIIQVRKNSIIAIPEAKENIIHPNVSSLK
jgi:hypothetical protein